MSGEVGYVYIVFNEVFKHYGHSVYKIGRQIILQIV
jgi:hypothetical protein